MEEKTRKQNAIFSHDIFMEKNVSFMISQKEYHGKEFLGSPGPIFHGRGPVELRSHKPLSVDNQIKPKKKKKRKKEKKYHGKKKKKKKRKRESIR